MRLRNGARPATRRPVAARTRIRFDPRRPERSPRCRRKGAAMGRGGIIWTVVGILLIIALIIYIF